MMDIPIVSRSTVQSIGDKESLRKGEKQSVTKSSFVSKGECSTDTAVTKLNSDASLSLSTSPLSSGSKKSSKKKSSSKSSTPTSSTKKKSKKGTKKGTTKSTTTKATTTKSTTTKSTTKEAKSTTTKKRKSKIDAGAPETVAKTTNEKEDGEVTNSKKEKSKSLKKSKSVKTSKSKKSSGKTTTKKKSKKAGTKTKSSDQSNDVEKPQQVAPSTSLEGEASTKVDDTTTSQLPISLPVHQTEEATRIPPTGEANGATGSKDKGSQSSQPQRSSKEQSTSTHNSPSMKRSSSHDSLPCTPRRRGSFSSGTDDKMKTKNDYQMNEKDAADFQTVLDNIAAEKSHLGSRPVSPGKSNASSSTSTHGLSAVELESYVMARIPGDLKEKLTPDAWNQIFAVAAESQCSINTLASPGSRKVPISTDGADNGVLESRDERTTSVSKHGSNLSEPSEIVCFDDDDASCLSGITEPRINFDDDSASLGSIDRFESDRFDSGRFNSELRGSSTHLSIPEGSGHMDLPPQAPSRYYPRSSSLPHMGSPQQFAKRTISRFSSDTQVNSRIKTKKSVNFATVHVRHYERVLEINPCTSSGPSVGIGWNYTEDNPVEVEKATNRIKRGMNDLIMSRRFRESLVKDLGYSEREIAAAVRKSLKGKHQRKQTYNNLHVEAIEYMVERSRRKVKRMLSFGAKDNTRR